MLERYFVRPQTVDRIRAGWIGSEIERYVVWLAEHGYSSRCVLRRVPLLIKFGDFAWAGGARTVEELPAHVEAFVSEWMAGRPVTRQGGRLVAKEVRGPVEQMLALVVPGFVGSGRSHRRDPFADALPDFFDYLTSERGLRPASLRSYQHHLALFEAYLARIGVAQLSELSPAILTVFVAERAATGLGKATIRDGCGVLRVFLRYAHREGLVERDLSTVLDRAQVYRLSSIPRSITWEEVGTVLAGVDRRSPCGKRDWAILMLLVTYGLRGREVATLTLDDIDWKRERLRVPERKAGHSTAFPLSVSVGEALLDYLQHGRPQTEQRRVFFRAAAPIEPIGPAAVSSRARHYLLKAGIEVPRPGSHTLRHTCVQKARRRRLRAQDDRRLHRAPLGAVHGDLCEGRGRTVAPSGARWRRRGRALMSHRESIELAVERFLVHKRALGRKYLSEQAELRLLVAFAEDEGVVWLDELTPALLDDFLGSRPRSRPRSFNHLLGVVACLLDWAVSQQLLVASPLRARRRRGSADRIPFLFDPVQARRLLDTAGALADNARAPQRGATYRTMFALSYGLGLRVGEMCGLRLGDVDTARDLLVVRGGKFGKSRLVPHGPRIAALLSEQLERRRESGAVGDEEPLFTFDGKRHVHPGTASQTFHQLVLTLDLTVPDGVSRPTLHCLRHSFAVGCLLRWYREGLDPAARLHQLSTFMGHVAPSSTAVYLTITPALLEEANRRFEQYAEPAWTTQSPEAGR